MKNNFNIIQYLKDTHDITSGNIAKTLKVSPAFISKLLGGKPIGLELAKKISQAYGLSLSFITGENSNSSSLNNVPYSSSNGDEAPYLENMTASAGLNYLTQNSDSPSSYIKIPGAGVDVYINVFGDSMYPKYSSGDIIGIKHIEKDMVFFGHAFVIEMSDGEAYIKYIFPGKDNDHWMLTSENQNFPSKEFHLDKILKVYKIKTIVTKNSL